MIDPTDRVLKLSRQSGPGSFSNALCENIAVGCTVSLNHSVAALVAKGDPTHSLMHDWWAYLVVSAVGRIFYDNNPWIQYRQHLQNYIDGNRGFILHLTRRLTRIAARSSEVGRISQQLVNLLNIHGDLLSYKQRLPVQSLLVGTTSLSQRLKNCIVPPATRQSWVDQLILPGILLTNRY